MKNLLTKRRAIFASLALSAVFAFESQSVQAQVKVGNNPATINDGSVLEIESTNRGVLLPRVSLAKTTAWGLLGTPTAGMEVFNTNPNISDSESFDLLHPVCFGGIGVYYWDGAGWVAVRNPDYGWRKLGEDGFLDDPSDLEKSIFHGGNNNQSAGVINTDGTNTDNMARLFVSTGGTSTVGEFIAENNFTINDPVVAIQTPSDKRALVFRTRFEELSNDVQERMRITSIGDVGIGTKTPGNKLHVAGGSFWVTNTQAVIGATRSTNVSDGQISLFRDETIAGAIHFKAQPLHSFDSRIFLNKNGGPAGALVFQVSNDGGPTVFNAVTVLNHNGNVGIGGQNNPFYKLDVLGDINASGEVRNSGNIITSDERLKEDIQPVQNGLEIVSKLKPVSYRKKQSIASHDYNKSEIGFIAQEVQKILPQLVREGKDADKTLSLDYNSLIPVLTQAIQEQQKEINALKAQNSQLLGKVSIADQSAKVVAQLSAELIEIKEMLKMSKKDNSTEISK